MFLFSASYAVSCPKDVTSFCWYGLFLLILVIVSAALGEGFSSDCPLKSFTFTSESCCDDRACIGGFCEGNEQNSEAERVTKLQ